MYHSVTSPNQSIYLHRINIIKLLQSFLDLSLIALNIAHKDQGIVLLDLLHRTFGVQWVDDNFMMVEAGFVRD